MGRNHTWSFEKVALRECFQSLPIILAISVRMSYLPTYTYILILLWYCTPLNDKKYKLMLVIALLKSTKVAKPMINFYPSIYL